jgi:hypothetical protein
MKYIPLRDHKPDQIWLTKSEDLLELLKAAQTTEERNEIIDKNGKVWGELKEWLLGMSSNRFWFSGVEDCFSHWDVEHYRPKKSAKDIDGLETDGYWWLAFDWQNFRICGTVGNRKKGTFFPLRDGTQRTAPFGELRYEDPLLLDPADPRDPILISFNVEGRAIPSPAAATEWEKTRVMYSVQRCNLDFPALVNKRKTVWNDCWSAIQEYLKELDLHAKDPTNKIAKQGCSAAIIKLHNLIKTERELSEVAKACIRSSGDPRLLPILEKA